MTTKDQERKALEAIKKILAGLDEDGYVRTAMQGVIEDAEDNIENDWAMSRYDAWQSAEQKFEAANAELKDEKIKSARLLLEKDKEIASLKSDIETLKTNVLTTEELGDIGRVASAYRYDCEDEERAQANAIVANADEPNSRAFKDAVVAHRLAQTYKAACDRVLDTLRVKFDI